MTRDRAIEVLEYIGSDYKNCAESIAIDVAIGALKQESKVEKALNLLADWAIECGFGFDNIPEEYEKYKDDIEEMGYREGLVYIVKKESEAKE